jgi:hypothetical protein
MTGVEFEEIKKELQGTQRSHLNEREQLTERLYTINDEEEKQNSEPTLVKQ